MKNAILIVYDGPEPHEWQKMTQVVELKKVLDKLLPNFTRVKIMAEPFEKIKAAISTNDDYQIQVETKPINRNPIQTEIERRKAFMELVYEINSRLSAFDNWKTNSNISLALSVIVINDTMIASNKHFGATLEKFFKEYSKSEWAKKIAHNYGLSNTLVTKMNRAYATLKKKGYGPVS